jgi:lysyl-tRNA synthetase, class II
MEQDLTGLGAIGPGGGRSLAARRPAHRIAVPLLAAALVNVAAAAGPASPSWVSSVTDGLDGAALAHTQALLFAVLLLVLARGVEFRRCVAHRAVTGLVAWSLLASAVTGESRWRLPVLALILVVLHRSRTWFPVLPELTRIRPRPWSAGAVGMLAACGALGLLLELSGLRLPRVTDWRWQGAGHLLHAAAWLSPGLARTQPWIAPALLLLCEAALLLVVVVLLMPAPPPPPAPEWQRRQVERLLRHPDSDTLAPFALRRDKTYVFSPDRQAAIGYRVLLGVAVAGGDPVGAGDAYPAAIREFLGVCVRHGWRPMAIGVPDGLLRCWWRFGLRSVSIGDEAVLDVGAFDAGIPGMRAVRKAINRTRNAGVTTEVRPESEVDGALLTELRTVTASWLNGRRYHGFSMNLDAPALGPRSQCLLVVARDGGGRTVAFQRYALCRGGRALTLDAMPRDRRSPNGVNERMIADLVGYARRHGIDRISLNFAAFRTLLDRGRPRTLVQRAGCRLVHLLDPLIMVESLHAYNAKFRPGWVRRHVVLGSWLGLGWYAAAALGVEFALPYARGRRDGTGPAGTADSMPGDERGDILATPELAPGG